jgi:ribosome maturation factor RimP
MEGNGFRSLLFLTDMNTDQQIGRLEALVNEVIGQEEGLFLVEIRIKPTNNIKVYLDGEAGVSIEKCVFVNRKLYKLLEENEMYPNGDFSLEVSSPGLDEPLKLHRQYLKNVSRLVEVTLKDGAKTEGVLKAVSQNDILVEETRGKNKKKETVEHTIPFDNIKTTKVQVVF